VTDVATRELAIAASAASAAPQRPDIETSIAATTRQVPAVPTTIATATIHSLRK